VIRRILLWSFTTTSWRELLSLELESRAGNFFLESGTTVVVFDVFVVSPSSQILMAMSGLHKPRFRLIILVVVRLLNRPFTLLRSTKQLDHHEKSKIVLALLQT
jgi:hypothetical protein